MASPAAPQRPRRSTEEVVNEILKRVLHVYVSPSDPATSLPSGEPLVLLDQLAAELLSESKPLLLGPDVVERALMARLDPELGADLGQVVGKRIGALQYCLGSYSRALEEGRKAGGIKDPERLRKVQNALEVRALPAAQAKAGEMKHPKWLGRVQNRFKARALPAAGAKAGDITRASSCELSRDLGKALLSFPFFMLSPCPLSSLSSLSLLSFSLLCRSPRTCA